MIRNKNALANLGIEARILQAIGPHRHIIGFKGRTKHGLLLAQDEKVQEDGLSVENIKSFMPRDDSNYADLKTEIFALGSYIMEGQGPYPLTMKRSKL